MVFNNNGDGIVKNCVNMNNNLVAENPRLLAPSVKYGAGNVVLSAAAASVGSNVAASGVCQMMLSDAGVIGALVAAEAVSAPRWWARWCPHWELLQ